MIKNNTGSWLYHFFVMAAMVLSRGSFLGKGLLFGGGAFSILGGVSVAAAMSTSSSSSSSSTPAKQGSKYDGAVIFLHGLGDTPAGWSDTISYMLPQMKPRLKNVKYVFPPAPIIPITINGGMTMPGWFDLYDWPIDVGCQDDKVGLLKGVEQIDEEVTKLVEEDNIPTSKIVVGGFSQGGAVALLAAYYTEAKYKNQYAGCVGLSAWLTLSNEFVVDDEKTTTTTTPLFWGHGRFDDKVLFQQQKFGVSKLKSIGITDILDEQYDMGHSSDPDELLAMAEFIDNCLFNKKDGDGKEL